MYIKAHVILGAKKEKVTKDEKGRFSIEVKEPAERNLANTRVCEIIAKEHMVSTGKARIVKGHRSPSKIISID